MTVEAHQELRVKHAVLSGISSFVALETELGVKPASITFRYCAILFHMHKTLYKVESSTIWFLCIDDFFSALPLPIHC
jgi:hypothetical protein